VLLGGAAEGNVGGGSVFAVEGGGAGVDGVKFGAGLEEADAAVPAKDAVVIAGGADFFGFGEAAQGFFDERKKNVGRTAGVKLGFRAAFVEKAGVIVSLVRVAERLKDGLDFSVTVGGKADELIGDGQAEHASSELMIGIDDEDIAADGFGFFGFMKVAVELDFGDGFGNTRFGYGFKLVRHGTSCFREARLVSRDPWPVFGNSEPGLTEYQPRSRFRIRRVPQRQEHRLKPVPQLCYLPRTLRKSMVNGS
jgi:hypothetical protein